MIFKVTHQPQQPKKIEGAGDVVAYFANPIKKAALRYGPRVIREVLQNCNCEKRRKALNKMLPL